MKRVHILLMSLLCLSGGCMTATEDSEEPRLDPPSISTEGLKPDCFYTRDVNNWEGVNKTQLIVYAPTKSRAYLVTIAPPAQSIRFSSTIGFGGRSQICGRPGEKLFVASGRDSSYMIMDVRRFDVEALESYEARKEAQRNEDGTAIPAGESPGAEVETEIKPDDAS